MMFPDTGKSFSG